MPDRLASAKGKLRRARKHIQDFNSLAAPWAQSEPYRRITYIDPATSEEVTKLVREKPLPEELCFISADAITNLRSALDQAAWAIAVASGLTGKHAQFPLAESTREVHRMRKDRSKEIPVDMFALMVSFEPYKGGNNDLWALHELCNEDKHRITSAASSAGGGSFTTLHPFGGMSMGVGVRIPPIIWDPEQIEQEVLRFVPALGTHYQAKIDMYLTFGHVEAIAELPIDRVLARMGGTVSLILRTIESEAFRTELFK